MSLPAPATSPSATSLATTPRILLLGEAESDLQHASGDFFAGPAGALLKRHIIEQSGLPLSNLHTTNVFSSQPPDGDFKLWTANKTELKKLGLEPRGAPLQKRYLLPDYWPQVEATAERITALKPDLIIALGAKALWFLAGDDRIGTFRGTFFPTPYGEAIATYNPGAVLREYSMLPVAQMDCIKARLHLEGSLPPPLTRRIWVNPSMGEIICCYARFKAQPEARLGVDIETVPTLGEITMISFATPDEGICIPFWNKDTPPGADPNYWPTVSAEKQAWEWVRRFAELPNPKVLQNGIYDMQYLLDTPPFPIRLAGPIDDTAILQHAYQPELKKDLGSLASFYLNEPSWKQMRTSAKDAKADE